MDTRRRLRTSSMVALVLGTCAAAAHTACIGPPPKVADDADAGVSEKDAGNSGKADSGPKTRAEDSSTTGSDGDAAREAAQESGVCENLETDAASAPDDAGPCQATAAAGAIALTGTYQSAVAMGGYAYAYNDGPPWGMCPTPSTICVDSTALCTAGVTSSQRGSDYSCFGGGVGFNLNQVVSTAGESPPALAYAIPSDSPGIAYILSAPKLPSAGLEVVIDHAGLDFCAVLTTVSGRAAWSSFNSKCYDTPPDGVPLAGPPDDATYINFQIGSPMCTTEPFDFCVNYVSFE